MQIRQNSVSGSTRRSTVSQKRSTGRSTCFEDWSTAWSTSRLNERNSFVFVTLRVDLAILTISDDYETWQ